jgi:7,8-dihydroneopterin aldolase/epimerase/oxygenase
MSKNKYILKLNNLILNVTLGVFDFEKKSPQKVTVNITLELLSKPNACDSDQHAGSICYAELSDKLQTLCNNTSFQMIEKMGETLAIKVQNSISIPANITLDITKIRPYPNLGSATFRVNMPWMK